MNKYIILLLLGWAAGCSTTVPVAQSFPSAPNSLLGSCPNLGLIQPTTKLSDVISVVSDNYSMYLECQTQNDSWIEWYVSQRAIFNRGQKGE